MDLVKMNELMAEITKGYNGLEPDSGELQNLTTLVFWFEDDYITEKEYEFLKAYNKELHNVLTNH